MPFPLIPQALKAEFATVEALWALPAATRAVDALILTWVKYERQVRRLFTFLVFQHSAFDAVAKEAVLAAILRDERLYPHKLLWGIELLAKDSMAHLMGAPHTGLSPEVRRIQNYRDKIFHGQLTGQKLSRSDLIADTGRMIAWMQALAEAGTRHFGYDGLQRNALRWAGQRPRRITSYPFQTVAEFENWLTRLSRGQVRFQAAP